MRTGRCLAPNAALVWANRRHTTQSSGAHHGTADNASYVVGAAGDHGGWGPRDGGDPFRREAKSAALALLLFVVAALGGVVLNLGYHLKAQPLPIWLVLVHAAIAVVAFVLLCVAAWKG